MARARKHGLMVLNMRVTTLKARRMDMVGSDGPMDPHMRDNSSTTTFMDRVFTYGRTLASMMESG